MATSNKPFRRKLLRFIILALLLMQVSIPSAQANALDSTVLDSEGVFDPLC